MSVAEAGEPRHEIIIVRRAHHDHDEGHHGGVWKIAFADFMTAMMCFFLVMWLINAANEQTKAAVASYFNPVRLIDRNASRKGLEDMGDGPRDAGLTADSPEENADKSGQGNDGAASSSQKQDSKAAAKQSDSADQRLFADPYAVLAEIATDTAALQNVSEKGDGGAQAAGPATGASGGTSYRDPFAPDFWSQQMATPLAEASAERARIEGDPVKPGDKAAEVENPKVKAVAQPAPAPNSAPLEALAKDETADAWKKAPPEPQAPDKKAAEEAPKNENAASGTALKAATEIKRQLAQAFKAGDTLHDGVSVEATDKGVVISITDRMDFGMFKIGSALLPPHRQRETAHRYMLGLYRVLEAITSQFPDILFESCSGGGGRFDPGMLYYMPQTWASDNTDAIHRLRIQYGTSMVYPVSSMGAHVSAVPNHQTGRLTSLQTRADVAMSGNFGYELDLTQMTDEEKAEVKKQVEFYKEIRHVVQFGEFYRLRSPFEGNDAAWMSVTEDGTEAFAVHVNVLVEPNGPLEWLKLQGLDPAARYRVEGSGEVYGGDQLMYVGLPIPRAHVDYKSRAWRLVRL